MTRLYRVLGSGLLGLLLLLSVSSVFAQGVIVKSANTSLGNILVDSKGMTLYIYTKDTPNTSTCYDKCATAWPPLLVPSGESVSAPGISGTWSTTQRTDGTMQVTYNGQPLYYWQKDTKPGDVTGQNVGNVWFVVKVDAAGAAPTNLPVTGATDNLPITLLVLALGVLAVGGGILFTNARRAH